MNGADENPADPRSEETIFFLARQLKTPEEQERFLAHACGHDDSLRRRLTEWLRLQPTLQEFMEDFPGDLSAVATAPATRFLEEAGARIGPFRLRERIGEGGCGVVYVAEQEQPIRRRVALKVIKLGMDTRQVIARFEAERQALAMMDHPNIAKVFDAGTTVSGRPYFVMELVRGIKITDYCDRNRLDLRQRLELFVHVCQAVQHAHQKGIIHRDLKPSNILVTQNDGRAVPKVIDFGIAKATEGRLTDKTIYTALHEFIGTPAYMSPEQAVLTSLDVDTRSDIYSLGVLLYELLTGRTPFDAKNLLAQGLSEMRRTICEVEPPRPSTRLSTMVGADLDTVARSHNSEAPKLVGLVRGDLDWIVMKCLDKDRSRRYATANGLAQDIERSLQNEPVAARPPSALYRLQKFARRNKLMFAAVSMVAAALIGGLTLATVMFAREKRARLDAVAATTAKNQALLGAQAAKALAERERWESYQHAYGSDIRIAQQFVDRSDLKHALAVLNRYLPGPGETNDLRGFEWRYLWERCQGDPYDVLPESVSFPWAMDVSPDGRYLAIASESGAKSGVTVWSLASKAVVARLAYDPLQGGDTACARFTTDGRMLVTACHERLKFFSASNWAEIPALTITNVSGPFDLRGETLVTTPPGHWPPVGAWEEIKIWNLRDRTFQILTNVTGPPTLSPDGRRVLLNSPEGLKVWQVGNLGTPPLLLEESLNLQSSGSGYETLLRSMAFSPDGRRIAVVGGHANPRDEIPVRVWDSVTGARIDGDRLTGHTAHIFSLAWSADSRCLATVSGDDTVRTWNLEQWKPERVFLGHLSEPWAVAFLPDGRRLISASLDSAHDSAKIWSLDYSAPAPGPTNEMYPVWISSDGVELITAASKAGGYFRNRMTGEIYLHVPNPRGFASQNASTDLMVITNRDLKTVLVGCTDGVVVSWPFGSTRFPRGLQAHDGTITGMAATADGRTLITAGLDGVLRWWDLASGELIRSNVLQHPITGAALSPDGRVLVCAMGELDATRNGRHDWQLKSLNPVTGELIWTTDLPAVADHLGFSPDGRMLAVMTDSSSDGQNTLVLDVASRTWKARIKGRGRRIDFSPDSTKLLVWTTLWDLNTDPPRSIPLEGHRQMVFHLTFSPDSRTVVSTSGDGTFRLWSAETGQEMMTHFERGRSFDRPLFSDDGTTLVVGVFAEDNRPMRFWHAPTLSEIDGKIRAPLPNR